MKTLTKAEIKRNKAEAIKRGEKTYDGPPCKYGHSGKRFVKGDKCVPCNVHRTRKFRERTGKTGKTIKSKGKAVVAVAPVTPITDDWQSLPAATRADLSKRAERIKAALRRGLIEVGRELTEARKVLNHGQFTAWVERETGLTPRTAQLIMSAYRLVSKNESFSLLGRSALFLLGAHDLPAGTINLLKERIEQGDVPTYTEVRQITRAPKPNPLNLAIKMQEPSDKAAVVDLHVMRRLAQAKADPLRDPESPERRELEDSVQDTSDRIKVAEIAIMLNGILDSHQVFRLCTMIRNAAPEATLAALADALERTDPIAETVDKVS
jgi:hypothetical protein